jgi:hypothetical protein
MQHFLHRLVAEDFSNNMNGNDFLSTEDSKNDKLGILSQEKFLLNDRHA